MLTYRKAYFRQFEAYFRHFYSECLSSCSSAVDSLSDGVAVTTEAPEAKAVGTVAIAFMVIMLTCLILLDVNKLREDLIKVCVFCFY